MANPLCKQAQQTLGGMVRIGKIVAKGSPVTLAFSSIPQGYTDLKIIFIGRDTATGSTDLAVRIKINGDATSGNYQASQLVYNNTATTAVGITVAASSAGADIARAPGTSGQANAMGAADILLPGYSGITFFKPIISNSLEFSGNAVVIFNMSIKSVWKSTAPITDIVLTAGGTAFVDGTTATLYGLG